MNTILKILDHHHLLCEHPRGYCRETPSKVVNDSRKVTSGSVFIAIPGSKFDGHNYVQTATANGAVLLIHSKDIEYSKIPEGTATLKVTDPYFAYSLLCEYFNHYPARRFNLHGITGTNGKTTTAFLLQKILNLSEHPCGLISTVKYAFGNYEREASRTTPEAGELQELFAEIAASGCTDAVMEFSSHGLAQHRAGATRLETAIFTNLTRDHLDYHHDMENYFSAKKKLFADYDAVHKIVNLDDRYGQRLKNEMPETISFGTNPDADYHISDITLKASGSSFSLNGFQIKTNLCGEHNIYNLTGALIAAIQNGIPETQAAAAAQGVKVPGRLEHFNLNGCHFYVDYAHTPDALERVLSLLRKLNGRRLITVFGCGGDRDRSKRPLMGKAVALNSDITIVTSDNPRNEEPSAIISEIIAGIPESAQSTIEPDRHSAIRYAAQIAQPGDIILIAGKGHENYQEIQGIKHYFDDRQELLNLMQNGDKLPPPNS